MWKKLMFALWYNGLIVWYNSQFVNFLNLRITCFLILIYVSFELFLLFRMCNGLEANLFRLWFFNIFSSLSLSLSLSLISFQTLCFGLLWYFSYLILLIMFFFPTNICCLCIYGNPSLNILCLSFKNW